MHPDLKTLLENTAWVRALARSLVADPHAADDLVQDTLVAAIEHPPVVEGAPLRRWLAGVMRNVARQRWRGEARLVARERAVARDEGVPSNEGMLERLDAHQSVVSAVRSLDEPYRSAILMRYFEGLRPREIARRTGTPVRTVHSRLNRALKLLRTRLDRDFGERRAWLLALVPLARPSGGPVGSTLLGVAIVNTKLGIVLASAVLAVLLVASILVWKAASPAESPAAPVVAGLDSPPAGTELPVEVRATREAVGTTDRPDGGEGTAAVVESRPRGRVLDVEGRGIPGVRLRLREIDGPTIPDTDVESGPGGTFEVPAAEQRGRVVLADERYTTILQPRLWSSYAGAEHVLVVAPRQPLAGVVVNASGNPLPDAVVEVDLLDDFRSTFDSVLEASAFVELTASCDEVGRFSLPTAPRMREAHLVTSLVGSGYGIDVRPLPLEPTWDLEIVLREREEGRLLRGTVLGEDGRPVAGAHVALDSAAATSGADGGFVLHVREPGERGILWAAAVGRLPARLEREGDSNLTPRAWPDPLELYLGGEALTIGGRVLDPDGEPVADAALWTDDLTQFGMAFDEENFGPRFMVEATVEGLLGGDYEYPSAQTDADGRFLLEGLLPRDYRLSVFQERSLAWMVTEPIAAGRKGVEIHLPAAGRHPRVAGRVVQPDGQPVGNAAVTLWRDIEPPGCEPYPIEGPMARTDEEGRFEFLDVSRALSFAFVEGTGLVLLVRCPILADADVADLELVAPRRCHLRLLLTDARLADSFSILDEGGELVEIWFHHGTRAWRRERAELVEDRSEVVSVSELARTLVLYLEDEEVSRQPLRLVPGELTIVRP